MSLHRDIVPLQHMRDFAVAGAEFAQNHIRADVDADCLVTLGLIKLVENIGEAATRLSPETQAACPQIPWRQIIAARHRLVHGYDRINYDVLWRILAEELPKLREQLDAVISTLGQAGT